MTYLKLFLCISACLLIGWLGRIITETSVKIWYPSLIKPFWTPPNWIFPIAWSFLYVLMGIALWLVWMAPTRNKEPAYFFFGCQLFLNFIWSWLFFYLENPLYGLMDIILLWLAIAITLFMFRKHSKAAALLMAPYLLWVAYAATLNYYIWQYN